MRIFLVFNGDFALRSADGLRGLVVVLPAEISDCMLDFFKRAASIILLFGTFMVDVFVATRLFFGEFSPQTLLLLFKIYYIFFPTGFEITL